MDEAAPENIQFSFAPLFKVLITIGKDDSDLWTANRLAEFNVLNNIRLL